MPGLNPHPIKRRDVPPRGLPEIKMARVDQISLLSKLGPVIGPASMAANVH
jgi:hypothetical protein